MAEDRIALSAVLVDVLVGKSKGHGVVSHVPHVKALGWLEVFGREYFWYYEIALVAVGLDLGGVEVHGAVTS